MLIYKNLFIFYEYSIYKLNSRTFNALEESLESEFKQSCNCNPGSDFLKFLTTFSPYRCRVGRFHIYLDH